MGSSRTRASVLRPSASLLVKLGSIAVHAKSLLSPQGHHFDHAAIQTVLCDPEVQQWVRKMTTLGLLPVRR